jgi:hypothetical protein
MHHEMQQFGNIRLKSLTVTLSLRHVRLPPFRFQMRLEDIPQLSPMARRCLPQLPRYCPAARRMQELRPRLFVLESSQVQKNKDSLFWQLVAKTSKHHLPSCQLQATIKIKIKSQRRHA